LGKRKTRCYCRFTNIPINAYTKKKSEPKVDEKQKGKQPKGKQDNSAQQSDISRLNIKVGKIVHVEKHPEAEKLYIEKIDIGEPTPRTIVSGLVPYVPIEQMINRHVLVLANLAAKSLKGITSQGMVLAASNAAHDKVELFDIPEGVPIGERITFEGETGEPDEELSQKNKIVDRVKNDLKTNELRQACYRNKLFMTSKGPITTASLTNANIG